MFSGGTFCNTYKCFSNGIEGRNIIYVCLRRFCWNSYSSFQICTGLNYYSSVLWQKILESKVSIFLCSNVPINLLLILKYYNNVINTPNVQWAILNARSCTRDAVQCTTQGHLCEHSWGQSLPRLVSGKALLLSTGSLSCGHRVLHGSLCFGSQETQS